LFEGFGLPVLEAMACGCPVIVSKTSSLPEVVGEAGIYVDPLDVSDIAKNLQSLIMNFKLREKLSKKSLEQAKKFSWEKAAKETIGVLERTIFLPSAP
jgi:glycosyltransferase involved in cell wall biosynthesis